MTTQLIYQVFVTGCRLLSTGFFLHTSMREYTPEEMMLRPIHIETTAEQGSTMLEYAMLAALISVSLITVVSFLGEQSKDVFDAAGAAIAGDDINPVVPPVF